ncbi:MAG: ABC transporter permease [Sphaerochaetaceae bacterium]
MKQNRKMFLRMITASLLRRRSRMIVALLSIAIGGTILSGLVTIYHDVPRQMGAQFRNYGANMILTPSESSFTYDDFNDSVSCISSGDLVGATPYRYKTVRIHEQPFQVAGTVIDGVRKTSPYWSIDGAWPAAQREMLLGKNVAGNLGLSAGSRVSVTYTPEDLNELDSVIDFVVTGIVGTGGNEENYVYMSLEDMQALTNETNVFDIAELSVSATSEGLRNYVDRITDSVEAVTANLVKRVTASEATVLSKLQSLVLLVTVIVLVLTMICVATTMTAVVSERRKEIGLRKAIGASDTSLIMEFIGEGMVLGGAGGLIGSLVGFAFAQMVSINVFGSRIVLHPVLVPVTIVISIIITGLASLSPIRSATKIDPALVLKGE